MLRGQQRPCPALPCPVRHERAFARSAPLGAAQRDSAITAADGPRLSLYKKNTPCLLNLIQRTAHAAATPVHHLRVNHGGRNIAVAQQLLHGADVVSRLQQMRGE